MSPTARAGDLRIVFEDTGRGSPAVVLIHGAFADKGHFAPQLEHLTPRHRVLVPDCRGHGESDVPSGGFGLREMAEDVIAVCDAAGVDRAVMVGHSWPVALEVASLRPDLVRAVALLDGVVLLPEAIREQALADLVPALESPGWADAVRAFLSAHSFPHGTPALKARVMEEIGRAPAQFAPQWIRDSMGSDWAEQLAASSYPLLYVHATVPADLGRLRQLRPDALVAAVAGAGHYMTLEVPDQVNAMLDRFLQLVEEREPAAV